MPQGKHKLYTKDERKTLEGKLGGYKRNLSRKQIEDPKNGLIECKNEIGWRQLEEFTDFGRKIEILREFQRQKGKKLVLMKTD